MNFHSKANGATGSKHRLLAQSRQWHKWGGLVAGIFVLLVAASGIVLNYKKPLFNTLGLEQPTGKQQKIEASEKSPKAQRVKSEFSTGNGLSGLPVSLERALEIARTEWGDVPLERIELKSERGETIYKLKQKSGSELWVNAATGDHFEKGEYERVSKAGVNGVVTRSTDWGKILIDLHTGKIGGEIGKAIVSIAALLLLLLTFSGFYMWLKPLLLRRQNVRAQARNLGRTPVPAAVSKPELVEV